MKMTSYYARQITDFINEFIDVKPAGYTDEGLTPIAIRQGLNLLLDEKIFISMQSMQLYAINHYGILVPECLKEK